MKIAVIIPTYNERENIEALAEEILALSLKKEIIIVDDNSPDGTGIIADKLTKTSQEVKVIHRPEKLGLGTAHISGFKLAMASDAELIVTMDADFSHQPRYIPNLVKKCQDSHLVIGSRYVHGGGTLNWGIHRQIISRLANTTARSILSLKAHDCTAGFRCYRREVLESIDLNDVFSNGYSFLVEMLFKCQQRGWKIGEVPIIFEERRRGASKISKREILNAMSTILRLGFKRHFSRS